MRPRAPRRGELEKKALGALDAWLTLWRTQSAAVADREVREAAATASGYLLQGAARGELSELLEAMDAVLNGRAATARDVISIAITRGTPEAQRLDLALREVLRGRGAPLTTHAVGCVLSSHKGARLPNGKRLLGTSYRNHSLLWRIATPK